MHSTIGNLSNRILTALAVCGAGFWSLTAMGAGAPGSQPGDENMTCQQIAEELQPYMKLMMPSVTAMGQTEQEVKSRGEKRVAEALPQAAAESAGASATLADPTGLASKIYGQGQERRQAERFQRQAAEDKPLNDKLKGQSEQVVNERMQMKSDARLQQLMQLAQAKNCH